MSRAERLLEGMRCNPNDDWTIQQIKTVSRHFEHLGVIFMPPTRGSHFKVTHSNTMEILTIPAHGRIKPVYIKRFVSMIDSIIEE